MDDIRKQFPRSDDDRPPCLIVGAGLTGATAAHMLRKAGWNVAVVERSEVVGGHVRNSWMRGLPYEPNGAHIFHTDDEAVWRLASSLVDFEPYLHQVRTRVGDLELSWPIQLDELAALPEWGTIQHELTRLPDERDSSNFETWCISLMGETLYHLFIEGYTTKQWGRPPSSLSCQFAPKRVDLRTDGYLPLFRDPYQGWPRQGYGALVEALLADTPVILCEEVTQSNLASLVKPDVPVLLTCALDDFFDHSEGKLEWRGVHLVPHYLPDEMLAQNAMVVNEPDAAVEYTRTVETKWVFPEMHSQLGTVIAFEYPGSPAKHYPVLDAEGANEAMQARYSLRADAFERNPLVTAGRLANYTYINMDEAMRQGMDAAARVQQRVGRLVGV
ncbi:MAG: FAD-dependent oxidoreductase [Actinomycetota bacterium]